MPWAGLQFVIVVFPYHTHLLFDEELRFTDILGKYDSHFIAGRYQENRSLGFLPRFDY